MKFLLDVCASSRALRALLIDLGHDVLSALEVDPRASDNASLAASMHHSLCRYARRGEGGRMRELLERHADAMRAGAIIIVTRGRVRIRLAVLDNGGASSQPDPW
jgi:hypothetical protein